MTKFFIGFILLGLAMSCGKGFSDKSKKDAYREPQGNENEIPDVAEEYLEILNEHRIKQKLRPLTYNLEIQEVSLTHAKAMTLGRPFGHMGFSMRCRWLENRVGKYKKCAEVVAMGQKNARGVFKAWYNSFSHRRELENPDHTHTGLGFMADEKGQIYWVQMFLQL